MRDDRIGRVSRIARRLHDEDVLPKRAGSENAPLKLGRLPREHWARDDGEDGHGDRGVEFSRF
jgi:hypothetical protein